LNIAAGDASRSNQDEDAGLVGEILVGEIVITACVEEAAGRGDVGERVVADADVDADSK
jgi:hypothetical protein